MKVNQIDDIFDNYDNYYALDEDSYIIGIQDPRNNRSSKKFLVPLFYFDGYNWERLDVSELGEQIFLASKPLDTEFLDDELIKIKGLRINTKRTDDDQYNAENSLTRYITHADKLDHLYDDQILDVFKGTLDLDRQLFYPKRGYYDLIDEVYVSHDKKFLVENTEDGKIYGVFTGIQTNSETKSVKLSMGLKKQVEVFTLPESTFLDLDLGKYGKLSRKLVKSYQDIELYVSERIDFLSRKDLFDWVEQQLSIKDHFETAGEFWDVLTRNSNLKDIKGRYERLKYIFEKSKDNLEELRHFLTLLAQNDFFKSQLGVLENQKLELENELTTLRLEKEQEIKTVEVYRERTTAIQQEINSLKADEEKIRQALIKEREEEIKREMEHSLKELDNIKNEIDEKSQLIEEAKSYLILHDVRKEIEELELFKDDLKGSINILKDEFTQTQNESNKVLQKLIRTKAHFDFLTGKGGSASFVSTDEENSRLIVPKADTIETLKELTQIIQKKLAQVGRSYQEHFITNLLISIHQNTLTLIWGLPGTGKTSLARLLTQTISQKNRVTEISVARGWTSQKDLIGFANPISKQFHKSSSGMYDLLKQLDMEMGEGVHQKMPMAYSILDEANLSPIEHYWGTFFNLTDSTASEAHPLEIHLGNNEKIAYPNNLRFVGTMNIDQTTEELSDRLLDRTPIIRLDLPKRMLLSNVDMPEIEPVTLSFEQIRSLFDLKDFLSNDSLDYLTFNDPDIEEKFESIETSLRYLGMYISPRVKKSIIEYCNVAQHVMSEQLRPLDYCIAQRILPKINFQGSEARDGLKTLLEKINEFGLKDSPSASILSKIIDKGEKEGYTQNYFSYFMID